MGPRRILFVNPTAKIGGGGEVILTYLVKHLCQSGYECAVAMPYNGEYVQIWQSLGCKCFELPLQPVTGRSDIRSLDISFHLRVLYAYYKVSIKLFKIIRVFQPQIVYANSFWAVFYVALLVKLLRLRLIWHVHDLIRSRFFNRIMISITDKFVDRLIVISNAVGQSMIAVGATPSKIVVIYNGIDTKRFDPQQICGNIRLREMLGIHEDDFVIVSIGRLIPRKGHSTLIRAIGFLARKYPNIRAIIVGAPYDSDSEQYRDKLRELTTTLGLQDKVLFAGWQPKVEQFILNSDVVVSVSWAEPFGLSIVEAMALGRPVIATNGGGEAEIVVNGFTGILVPPKDEKALATAIVQLMEDRKLSKKMGDAAVQRARECFSVTRFVSDIIKVLE